MRRRGRRMGARRLAALALAAGLAAGVQAAEAELQSVTVKPGDTLWGIAQKYLKDPTSWNEVLKHNRLPTSDPTVALPGMVLRVPKELIKDDAAEVIHIEKRVLRREKDKADWVPAALKEMLFHDYGLRTLADSTARVRFVAGSVLALDPDSMAILKAPRKADHDLRLMRGGMHATLARVETPSARIIPQGSDTKYSARVLDDLSTRVQVYKGAAAVEAAGKTVEVRGGQFTEVPLNRAPAPPSQLPKMAALAAEVGSFGAPGAGGSAVVQVRRIESDLAPDARVALNLAELQIGVPVAAYHVQVARSPTGFDKPVFEKAFDSGERIDLASAGLPNGSYWVRAAVVDLLGATGDFSKPKPYRVGGAAPAAAPQVRLELVRPEAASVRVRAARYRILGRVERGILVSVNGARAGVDEDGAFSADVLLKAGANPIRVVARDLRGNQTALERTVTYEP